MKKEKGINASFHFSFSGRAKGGRGPEGAMPSLVFIVIGYFLLLRSKLKS